MTAQTSRVLLHLAHELVALLLRLVRWRGLVDIVCKANDVTDIGVPTKRRTVPLVAASTLIGLLCPVVNASHAESVRALSQFRDIAAQQLAADCTNVNHHDRYMHRQRC